MYHTISFRSMNTDVTAWLWSSAAASAKPALRAVEEAFGSAHARFTRFESTSELSALNASGGRPFRASPELFDVVASALRYVRLTGGLFNPAILGALEAVGYDRTFEEVKRGATREGRARPAPVASQSVALDAERCTITMSAGTRLDLGGIAKGWTVYRAARQLSQYGPCLVDAGGDMMTLGVPPGESGWSVGVADPHQHARDVATLRLRDAAVATSGSDRRRWLHNGVAQHHLIDPRTGRPSDSDLASVTLVAPTTTEAEVYAKVIFLLGSRDGLACTESRASLAALLVTRDGDVIVSSRMEKLLHVNFTYASLESLAA